MESRFPGELRKAFNEAAQHVTERAAGRVPKRSGRLAQSIRPASTQRTGRVAMGSDAVPWAGFIEFGGRVGRNKSVVRPFIPTGRYLFPSAEREREPIARTLEDALGDLIRRAGL